MNKADLRRDRCECDITLLMAAQYASELSVFLNKKTFRALVPEQVLRKLLDLRSFAFILYQSCNECGEPAGRDD